MFEPEQAQGAVLKKIARRVEDILQSAREREQKGQHLALEIDAKFRLQDTGAVQFQLASAILEEIGGLEQEEVVSELLSLGLAAVLDGAAKATNAAAAGQGRDGSAGEARARALAVPDVARPAMSHGSRTVH